MPRHDFTLISARTFREMAKKGARAADFVGYAVFKAGTIAPSAAAGEPVSRDVSMILSNDRRDREGDTISSSGWDLKNYLRSPVVLWAHLHDALPIAKASNVRVEAGQLKATDTFAPPDVYGFADTVLKLIRGGYLNACSVGFKPGEFDPSDTGIDFKSGHELLEHSIVPVPAHADALVEAKSRGIDVRPVARWVEEALDMERRTGDGASQIRKQLERLRVQADPRGRSLFAALSHVKLPTLPLLTAPDSATATPDPEEAGRQEQYQALQQNLAASGVHLSMAADRARALVRPSEPATSDPDPDDDPPSDVDHLSAIVTHSTNAAQAAQSVAAMATQLGGAPADAPSEPVPTKALTRAARERVMLKLFAAVTAMQRTVNREGRRNSAADLAMIQHVHDLAGQLGATATRSCAPAEAPKSHRGAEVLLDGKPLLDPDEIDLSGITEQDIADVVGRVIAENLMRTTGRLP